MIELGLIAAFFLIAGLMATHLTVLSIALLCILWIGGGAFWFYVGLPSRRTVDGKKVWTLETLGTSEIDGAVRVVVYWAGTWLLVAVAAYKLYYNKSVTEKALPWLKLFIE